MAEHTPDIDALAFEWGCVARVAQRRHLFKLAQCIQGISIAMPMYVMDDRLHAQDGVVGTSCPIPWCAAKALLDISWLGISPAKAKLRFWDRDLSACETVNGNTLRFRSAQEAPLKDNSIAARSLITQMETVKVQSAELRHFGVEREWGDTHIMALKSRVRMQEWAAKTELSQSIVRSLDAHIRCRTVFDDELRADALLYASLLEEYDCGEEITFFRGNLHWDVRRTLSTAIQGRRLGKVMFSVEGVFRSAIHLRVTREEVEAMDERVELVQKTVKDADPSILSHRVDNPVEYCIHLMRETTMIKNIQAIRDHCASWDVSEVVEAAAVSMLQKGRSFADVVQQVDTVGALM
jgi:hypothetical protein